MQDHKRMCKLLEEAKPSWIPGQTSGYHGITYGPLVDQLVRRIDPQQRSVGRFFRDEVAKPYGKQGVLISYFKNPKRFPDLDIHIGLPREQFYRMARPHWPRGLRQSISRFILNRDGREFSWAFAKQLMMKNNLAIEQGKNFGRVTGVAVIWRY